MLKASVTGDVVKRVQTKFPVQKTVLVLLILIITISTNDVNLRFDQEIRDNYSLQLLIIFFVSLIFIHQEEIRTTWDMKLLASGIITLLFYLITAPSDEL